MTGFSDPNDIDRQLAERHRKNYEKRDGERTFTMYFEKDRVQDVQFFVPKAGEHEIDIIPYPAGANDPNAKEGEAQYVLDIYVHRNVGPGDKQFPCPKKNFDEPCPICQEHDKMMRDQPEEGTRRFKEWEVQVKALRPSRRCAYNVVCLDSEKEEDKGVQVFEIAHWFMESKLLAVAKQSKRAGGGQIFFAASKGGRTIRFVREGQGAKNTQYLGHSLIERTYDINAHDMKAAHVLDELVHWADYDEIANAFYGEDGKPVRPRVREESEDDTSEDDPPPRRRSERATEDAPVRRRGAAAEDVPAEDDPPPRRRGAAPAPAQEDDPPPRRRSERAAPAEDDPPPRRAGRGNRCPVPGGVFGKDNGEFEECDDCPLWEPCWKERNGAAGTTEDQEAEGRETSRRRGGREVPFDAGQEDDPPPPRRAAPAPEPEPQDDPPPRRRSERAAPAEDDPPPRRRGAAPAPAQEDDPPPRRRSGGDEPPPPRRRVTRV